jgi:hypothetical protein
VVVVVMMSLEFLDDPFGQWGTVTGLSRIPTEKPVKPPLSGARPLCTYIYAHEPSLKSSWELDGTKKTDQGPTKKMATTNENTTTTFSQDDRLEKLPPLSEQYAIDDLLTEHFGFAPKVFTGM